MHENETENEHSEKPKKPTALRASSVTTSVTTLRGEDVRKPGLGGWVLDSIWSRASLVALPIGLLVAIYGGAATGVLIGAVMWGVFSTISMAARALGGDIPESNALPDARVRPALKSKNTVVSDDDPQDS